MSNIKINPPLGIIELTRPLVLINSSPDLEKYTGTDNLVAVNSSIETITAPFIKGLPSIIVITLMGPMITQIAPDNLGCNALINFLKDQNLASPEAFLCPANSNIHHIFGIQNQGLDGFENQVRMLAIINPVTDELKATHFTEELEVFNSLNRIRNSKLYWWYLDLPNFENLYALYSKSYSI